MRRLKLIVCMLATGSAYAQFSNTINQTVVSGLTTVPYTSAALTNIGQGFHILQITLRNAPAQTCANTRQLSAELDYSRDGTTYSPLVFLLSDPNSNSNFPLTVVRYAIGAYPALRLVVRSFDTINCVADVFYSGSLFPAAIPVEFNGFYTGQMIAASGNGAVTGLFTPVLLGASILVIAQHKYSIYGLQLFNGSATAETVILAIGAGNSATCAAAGDVQFVTYVVAPNSSMIWPVATVPYWSNPGVGSLNGTAVVLCASLGANASGHAFVGTVTYRIEPQQ